MDIQNLLSQMASSSNPMQMLMGMLTPQQKQTAKMFQSQPSEKQAEMLANYCNQNGISKQQFTDIMRMLKGKA